MSAAHSPGAGATAARSTPTHGSGLLAVACLAFFATGMAAASIGPAMPDFVRQTGAGTIEVGFTLVAMSAGGLAGQFAAGLLGGLVGRRAVMLAGMSAFVTGGIGLAASSTLAALLTSASCLGVGCGTVVLIGNVIAAEASDGAGPLNLVNAMFGLGAILSPALIGTSMTLLGSAFPALWATPFAQLIGLVALAFWLPASSLTPGSSQPSQAPARPDLRAGMRSPLLWALSGLVLFYVATESSVGGWLSTILEQSTAMPFATGALVTSWFYFAHTSARFGAAWASRRVAPAAMLRASVFLCIGGAALLAASAALGSQGLAIVSAAVLGVSIGPIMPAALAVVRSTVPLDTSVAMVIVMGFGTFGGIAMPWTLGVLIFKYGAVAGTLALLVFPVAMAVLLSSARNHGPGKSFPNAAQAPFQTK